MYQLNLHKNYQQKKVKKTKVWNLILILLIVTTILFLLVFTIFSSKPNQDLIEIKIERGDTLWNIVSQYNSSQQDPRRLIHQIKKINDLDDVILQPGQIIKVPRS